MNTVQTPRDIIRIGHEEICGLKFLTAEAEIPVNIGRLIEKYEAVGFVPRLVILNNQKEHQILIFPNRNKLLRNEATKTMATIGEALNSNDETAKFGGSKWTLDREKVILHSPNHGFSSSLTLKEIIRVIGMKQFFSELKKQQKIVFLPLPGQVDASQSIRMMMEGTPGKMPIGGKVEVIKGKVKITL